MRGCVELTITWECVNGHPNTETFDLDRDEVLDSIQNYLDGSHVDCETCGSRGTDDGVYGSSPDPYLQGIIDYIQRTE